MIAIGSLLLLCLSVFAPCNARTGSTADNGLVLQQDTAKSLIESAWEKLGRFNEITAPQPPSNINGGPTAAQVPCTCGVFLSGQFEKGSSAQPRGHAALMHEQDALLACNQQGNKQCTNRCLEMVRKEWRVNTSRDDDVCDDIIYNCAQIVKHLPNSPNIICGTIDRDCHRERAYLFIQNCNSTWLNTKLSAGREYCCKSGVSVPCPLTL